ncbi:sulfotransferase [Nocardioides sp.]|uniref:sulfotransferase family protein n=1 Tax=Nocardioides sp. TaxID=35761 RepID=UPI001A350B87|nr:sulfotransferase [Nocardioides sp.]MBJ7359215.1 sulfotransferase [Nocardioides sp.]
MTTTDDLLAEASQRAGGLTDTGDDLTVPLAFFTEALEQEARLTDFGDLVARERILLHLVNRLNYVEDRKKYPEIAEQRVERPVFIIGFPRTGTTILHDILAQDPASRAPLTWETMFPSPPPEAATFGTDPRIALAASLMPTPENETESDRIFRAMHPIGAELTQECVVLMGETMVTPLFHNQFRVPTYMDWVDQQADFGPVYDFHLHQLQHLQSRGPAHDRWVLKTGAHMWGLEHLLRVYPDARIVFTHRDPVRSVTSYASLTAHVRRMFSDEVDPFEIAEDWTARLERVVTRTLELRAAQEFPEASFYDMYFTDFVADQFGVIQDIYRALDLELTDEAARAMQAFIADNPKGKHGLHTYTPEEYGLVPEKIREQFSTYIERFGLSTE